MEVWMQNWFWFCNLRLNAHPYNYYENLHFIVNVYGLVYDKREVWLVEYIIVIALLISHKICEIKSTQSHTTTSFTPESEILGKAETNRHSNPGRWSRIVVSQGRRMAYAIVTTRRRKLRLGLLRDLKRFPHNWCFPKMQPPVLLVKSCSLRIATTWSSEVHFHSLDV